MAEASTSTSYDDSVLDRITARELLELADENLTKLIIAQTDVIENIELNSPESVEDLSKEVIYKMCLQYTQGYLKALGEQLIKDNPNFRTATNEDSESSTS